MAHSVNVKGLVNGIKIKAEEFLLPLLEVLVNAIQSIEDSDKAGQGEIFIKVLRNNQLLIENNKNGFYPITGFEVSDNGIGFTNFQALVTNGL